MMVIFVSQCEKKALARTRRVLDAFADRIGDNTWQTVITAEGLQAVRKLLRKTASKSTAVSCHWIRHRSRSDLLWIVGNRKKFNERGLVPVNYTESEMNHFMDKEKWQSLPIMKHAVVLAGLFHDFGKANQLFQNKLNGQSKQIFEPVRHEWVSLRIFEAFVGDKTDEEWLAALAKVAENHSDELFEDGLSKRKQNPLAKLPPFAQLVGWLIVSHHKMPVVPDWKKELTQETEPRGLCGKSPLEAWFERELQVEWNSYNFREKEERYEDNWRFHDDGLPYKSFKWRLRAMKAADQALSGIRQIAGKNLLHDELFTTHLARMALMLADHNYSAKEETTEEWQAPNYEVYANTSKESRKPKQKLDEHLIGVSRTAKEIVDALPLLRTSLPALTDNDFLQKTKEEHPRFQWQVDAQKKAKSLSESSVRQGFFGINMASTGKGKTLANAKIMYALADQEQDCRFTVALGLRTLTLQTGREYRKELRLSDEQLAIAVGGSASKTLFENEQAKKDAQYDTGSESSDDFLAPDLTLDFQQEAGVDHSLYSWTKTDNRIEKLLQAPVLVCTIDHLIPATDGTKGGKQIGPMLRLLTSDLVIDEPDDFGLEDLPALCRLVHWAGMLGCRVLLSTATMPPDLALATFEAYQAGWSEYAKVNISNPNSIINCAWFDERKDTGAVTKEIANREEFEEAHRGYVEKRVEYLDSNSSATKHKGDLLENVSAEENIYKGFAETILKGALDLHEHNHVEVDSKRVSIGLVRMANINPLVAVAKELIKLELPTNYHLHLCVYHSRYPLAVRSHLENKLDSYLNRKGAWPPAELGQKLNELPSNNHIIVVLASPVAEVGRDHDYDWAIIEPSSMRSIIQIAGRVLRHRNKQPSSNNILLINQNIKQLKGKAPCFVKPGFEAQDLKLEKHQLNEVLLDEQYSDISAKPRVIKSNLDWQHNLVALEHHALQRRLFDNPDAAKLWWREQVHWCGVLQKRQPFRKSLKDEALYLVATDGGLKWQWKNENVSPPKMGEISASGFDITNEGRPSLADRVSFLFDLDPETIYATLAKDLKISCETEVSQRFGEMRLASYDKKDVIEFRYCYELGIYQDAE